jgi:hypothetical protein
MLVIGLGKQRGADQIHSWGVRGLREIMYESARTIVAKTPFVGGLAVVENANEETAHVEVVDRDDLFAREAELLDQARGLMGRLPFPEIDTLIVGETGKNYSGSGMDPNVLGRMLIEATPEAETNDPKIVRVACLDLSPESHGNGVGIGLADLTTNRLLAAIDPVPTRMNTLTARSLWRCKLPLGFDTDRECVAMGVHTCWQPVFERVKFAVIPNTLEVAELWVSAPLAAEARANPNLEVVGPPVPLPFDPSGTLKQEALFPHCLRARRKK